MPYAFHWLTLPDLQGSVKRGKGKNDNSLLKSEKVKIFTFPFTTFY